MAGFLLRVFLWWAISRRWAILFLWYVLALGAEFLWLDVLPLCLPMSTYVYRVAPMFFSPLCWGCVAPRSLEGPPDEAEHETRSRGQSS